MVMKKQPIRRKVGGRKKGKNDYKMSWKNLPETIGNQVKIQFYVEKDLRDRMEKVGPLLVEMEKNNKNGGIIRNTPGLFCKYCCITITVGLEKMIVDLIKQQEQERINAITPNTHNNG